MIAAQPCQQGEQANGAFGIDFLPWPPIGGIILPVSLPVGMDTAMGRGHGDIAALPGALLRIPVRVTVRGETVKVEQNGIHFVCGGIGALYVDALVSVRYLHPADQIDLIRTRGPHISAAGQ